MNKRTHEPPTQSAQIAQRPAAGEVWQPRSAPGGPRAIAGLIPRITEKSFEKHGFAAASLIMDWATIVDPSVARNTRPVQLKWPRPAEKSPTGEADSEGRPAATLVLEVDPAVALDVDYQSAQLIERINAYFGYRAVVTLRLLQVPIAAEASSPETPGPATAVEPAACTDPLTAALERLGRHVTHRSGPRR